MRPIYFVCQGFISAIGAWISAKLGILAPVLVALMIMMAVDYVTGMLAAKTEAILYPDDPAKGWNSKGGGDRHHEEGRVYVHHRRGRSHG